MTIRETSIYHVNGLYVRTEYNNNQPQACHVNCTIQKVRCLESINQCNLPSIATQTKNLEVKHQLTRMQSGRGSENVSHRITRDRKQKSMRTNSLGKESIKTQHVRDL